MHSIGLAHNDLKTENVFLDSDFTVKLGDFGVGSRLYKQMINRVGTRQYRPPESLIKNWIAQTSSDIFSLGVILFVIIIGQMPFIEPNASDAFYQHFYPT